MAALLFYKILHANIIPDPSADGYVQYMRVIHDISSAQWADSWKNQIMIGLSGGIAMSIMEDQELDFTEFLSQAERYGMGSRDKKRSDLYDAYQNARKIVSQYYLIWWTMSSEEAERKINALVEQSYYEARDILSAHKDRLVLMSDDLYRNKALPGHRLEVFVDSSKY